jgi:hypothetical protein
MSRFTKLNGDSIEVFYADRVPAESLGDNGGWFWWSGRAGCLPDVRQRDHSLPATSHTAARIRLSFARNKNNCAGVSILLPSRFPVEARSNAGVKTATISGC